jgi:hypothetical protein
MNDLVNHVLSSAGGKFDATTTSNAADVSRILKRAMDMQPSNGLLLHFHGGLIKREEGLRIANRLLAVYETVQTYPVFFVWESGVLETILNNKKDILADPVFRELVKKVTEWVLRRFGGMIGSKEIGAAGMNAKVLRKEYDAWFEGERPSPPVPEMETLDASLPIDAPQMDQEKLAKEIEATLTVDDPDFEDAIKAAYRSSQASTSFMPLSVGDKTQRVRLSEAAKAEMFPAQTGLTSQGLISWLVIARFIAKIVVAVYKRCRTRRDHGCYCTIVEEILRVAYGDLVGATIWNAMKKDTQDSFSQDPLSCGHTLVEVLKELENSGNKLRQLTLVGHSTGAIYICHFLDAAKSAGLKTPIKIVLLAPAVTHDLMATTLKSHQDTSRIRQFRLFGMRDDAECGDKLLGRLYTRSLLYFVSGLLEGSYVDNKWTGEIDMPIGGMQRYLNEEIFRSDVFGSIKFVRDFLSSDSTRAVWSPSNRGPGLSSQSKAHGDFDNDDQTLESVKVFISE